MDKKIIFIDIDGTLTEPGCNIPPASALKAVSEARANGHLVFLCTGRNYGMLSPLLGYGFDGFVGSSGGYIQCGDQIIYDCPMTDKQRDLALEALRKNGVFCTVESREGSYTDEGFKEFLKRKGMESGNSELLRWREQIEKSLNILPMREYQGEPVYKIVIMSKKAEQLEEPRRVLGEDFYFCMQEQDGLGIINGEIVNRKFDKGKGLERVCSFLGADIRDTIAFGDSMNDVEMMKTAGLSICMENGSGKLKQLADEICPAVTEDGLYRAFKKQGLI